MKKSLLFLTVLMTGFTTVGSFAMDAVEKGERKAEKDQNAPIIAEPNLDDYQDKSQEVYDLLKEISDGLSEPEKKHFGLIYSNYNLLGTVKMVQSDVGKAIDACSTANPGMENDLRGRFQEWNNAINPTIEDADAHINNMVAAQEYAKPKKIKSLFKAIDQTRKFTNKQAQKTPVTSQDACEYLLKKMDDTQKDLVFLMRETLISVPAEPAYPVENVPAVEAPAADEKPAKSE